MAKASKKYQYARTNEYLPKATQQEICRGTVRERPESFKKRQEELSNLRKKRPYKEEHVESTKIKDKYEEGDE